MDIIRSLRNQGNLAEGAETKQAISASSRPQTLTEMIDGQISYFEKKIADLKEAKAAISPEVEKAINALAKIS